MRNYRNYDVWKLSHEMAKEVYQVTKGFPKEELYGIVSQVRRAALSVPTNIVEGAGRNSKKEFAHFLNISSGSAAETEYLLIFSTELELIDNTTSKQLLNKVERVRKMLVGLHKKVLSEA